MEEKNEKRREMVKKQKSAGMKKYCNFVFSKNYLNLVFNKEIKDLFFPKFLTIENWVISELVFNCQTLKRPNRGTQVAQKQHEGLK